MNRDLTKAPATVKAMKDAFAAVHPVGYTHRTRCGHGRATYRPDWGDTVRPWVVYINGEAMAHRATLAGALAYLRQKGCRL
jgi:hypothetical protein